MRDIKSFIVKQDGPIELTNNLGDGPTFYVPVDIDVELTDGEVVTLADIDKLYYNSAEGWNPINKKGEECHAVAEFLPSDVRDISHQSEKIADLERAIGQLADNVLAKTIEIAEALWGEHVAYLEVHDDDL